MIYKRPQCENCGRKIFLKAKPFRTASYLFGEIPSHCPDCGKELTNAKRAQLHNYSMFVYGIWCIIFISVVIIVLIIFSM